MHCIYQYKSAAITKGAQDPIQAIQDDSGLGEIIINKPTSSAMQRILSDLKMGTLVSGEMYDPLNKLLKSYEDNAPGNAQLYSNYIVESKLTTDLLQKNQGR